MRPIDNLPPSGDQPCDHPAHLIDDRLLGTLRAYLGLLLLVPSLALFPCSMKDTEKFSVAAGATAHSISPPTPEPRASQGTDWLGIVQEDLQRQEYHITWQETPLIPDGPAGYQAPNRAHNLRIGFAPTGIHIVERDAVRPSWNLGLALTGLGTGGAMRGPLEAVPTADATASAIPSIHNGRIEYRRGSVVEWYVNDERGLEQGFVVPNPKIQSPSSKSQSLESNPRPPAVLEIALSGDLIPQIAEAGRAVEFTTTDGTPVLRYSLTQATDAAGLHVPTQMEIEPHRSPSDMRADRAAIQSTQYAIRITHSSIERPPTYPLTLRLLITALPSSADWIGESDQDNAHLGQAISTAGDVDGDGYSDLVVGAPWYDGGHSEEGAAFVYYGGPDGLDTANAWSVHPTNQESAHFGAAVSIAGDVNGDGYADILIGAPDFDDGEADRGAVFVYHGGPGGLTTGSEDWKAAGDQGDAHFGTAASTAGDVNGDGYSDVLIGAPDFNGDQSNEGAAFVYHGGPTGLITTPLWSVHPTDQGNAHFGTAASTAGDVNGDGYADILIGAPDFNGDQSGEGAAFVYHGGPTGLITTPLWSAHPTDQGNARFGAAASAAGDVNGDGYSDVLIGAPDFNGDQSGEGAAFVYHGGPTGLITTPLWSVHPTDQGDAHFGAAVSTAGDVNGDGYADVLIGAPDFDDAQSDEGAAFVYLGESSGPATTPTWSTHPTDQGNAHFGIAVATAGDVNGDGYSDLAIGAIGYDHEHTDEGGAFVYHGAPDGLSTSSIWHQMGRQAEGMMGWSVSTAGDVNGDGYADVLVGAPRYDRGQTEEGVAFLYTGGPDGPASQPTWTGESDQAWAWFGLAVASAGDVDGDGYSDIVVGAPRYDLPGTTTLTDAGRAFVYRGTSSGVLSATTWITNPINQVHARFGTAVSTAGDVNGDGYSDVLVTANGYDGEHTNEGAAFVFHGGAAGLDGQADWTVHSADQTYANFGRSASTAGDVNGDGYSDVIVGAPWYEYPETENTLDGKAFVYYGSSTGLSAEPDWTIADTYEAAELGVSVSTAGDVNGDGYSDIVIGGYRYQGLRGIALVYRGSATGLGSNPDWTASGSQENAKFGIAVSTAGDVDGNGYSDVVIGAHNFADGQLQEGMVEVYAGGPTGLSETPAWSVQGNQQGAAYGFSVSTAGDVNGDGYGDIIVGAPTYNSAEIDAGRAYIYLGNDGDGMPVIPRQMRSDDSAAIAPLGRSDGADQVQLQVTARTPLGRGPVKMQWQLAPLGTCFTAATAISGTGLNWSDVFTTGAILSQTVDGLSGDTVYRWRVRVLYRPGDRLGQAGSRWFYMPWNGPQEADFRTANALAPEWSTRIFLPMTLRSDRIPTTP